MAATYTAVVQQHGEWWIGWVEEVPGVNSQGQNCPERRNWHVENLRDALAAWLPLGPGRPTAFMVGQSGQ